MSKPKTQTRPNMTTIDLAIDISVTCYRAKPELMMPLAAVEVKISSTDRPGPSIYRDLTVSSPPHSLSPQPLATSAMSPTSQARSQVPATSSSSNFQLIFNTALKAYEKKTKRDLLAHPLVSQLQTCDSSTSILAVLQSQVDDLDQAQKNNEGLTKWLSPTVNVLLTFSATIGGGVSLVSVKCSRLALQFINDYVGFLTRNSDLCWSWCPSPGRYFIFISFSCNSSLTSTLIRRLRTSVQRERF